MKFHDGPVDFLAEMDKLRAHLASDGVVIEAPDNTPPPTLADIAENIREYWGCLLIHLEGVLEAHPDHHASHFIECLRGWIKRLDELADPSQTRPAFQSATLDAIQANREREGLAVTTPTGVRVLYSIDREGPAHRHALRIIEVAFDDCVEVYVETHEPGACGCVRRIALSELVHLLADITDMELLTIPNREIDPAGHPHHITPLP